jgi:predicted dehydrogenase
MKIGIIGVGPWGRTVAATFERAGHVVAAHDRRDREKFAGDLGQLVFWPDMIAQKLVDAVVCATPPDVTKAVFDACQARRMPCLLSKPLLISGVPKDLSAPAFVDYVHLASPIYERMKKNATVDYGIEKINVIFVGSGPDRSFSGLLDYGAHALAMVHDLLGLAPLKIANAANENQHGRDLVRIEATAKNVDVNILTGNGASGSTRRVEVWLKRGPKITYDELNRVATFDVDGKLAMRIPGHDPLSVIVDRFAWDVDAGRVNPYFVELSAAVTRSLEEIRSKVSP